MEGEKKIERSRKAAFYEMQCIPESSVVHLSPSGALCGGHVSINVSIIGALQVREASQRKSERNAKGKYYPCHPKQFS
jgi:hypothetical protein